MLSNQINFRSFFKQTFFLGSVKQIGTKVPTITKNGTPYGYPYSAGNGYSNFGYPTLTTFHLFWFLSKLSFFLNYMMRAEHLEALNRRPSAEATSSMPPRVDWRSLRYQSRICRVTLLPYELELIRLVFLAKKSFFLCSRSRRTVWGWKLPEMAWYRIMVKNKIII